MKVSIYCLVYNHGKYLRDALEGFVNQITDFDYEVIVHDDASTDNSSEIIMEYARKYPTIIKPIIQKENQYSKGVRILDEYVLPRLTGDYIAICEGDDYWTDRDKLQVQADFLDLHLEYSGCVHNTIRKDLWHNKEAVMYPIVGDHDLNFESLIQDGGACYHTSSLMYRCMYALERPEFFNKAVGYSDYPLAIYLVTSGKVRFIDRVMSTYRYGTEGSWSKRTAINKKAILNTTYSKIEMLKSVDQYMNYSRTEEVQKVIRRYEYVSLELTGRFNEMKCGEYRYLYNKEPLFRKFKIYMKEHFGVTYEKARVAYYSKKH